MDGYITITRQWNTGDVIDIKLPMDLNLYVSRESNNVVAFKYGPILLAGEMKNNEVLSLVVVQEILMNLSHVQAKIKLYLNLIIFCSRVLNL